MRNFIAWIVFFTICLPFPTWAQNKNGSIHVPDTLDAAYIRFTGIEITGNKLTKPKIIERELDFAVGDSLATFQKGKRTNFSDRNFYPGDSSELRLRMNYSRENLINTKLFLTVDISLKKIQKNQYTLLIDVTERHYWWLFPVAKLNAPNFNEWLRDPNLSDLSMGLFFSHNNLFGLSHQTSLVAYVGKSWAIAFGYRIPWIGKGEKIGLTMTAGYSNLYTVEYASVENKRQMLYAPNSSQDVKIAAKLSLRPGLYNYGTIKLTGEYITISDSMYSLDTNYLSGNKKSNTSLSLYADYYYDSRNNHSYPLKGNMLRVFINKVGMGLISKDINLFYYGIDFHFYQALSKKWSIAEMVKAENSAGENAPYYYQLNMTQGKDFIRGFDLYTIKGDQIYYCRNNIKYELVEPSLKKVKEGQEKNKFKALQYAFYLNAFADAGYVVNNFTENNPYNNKFLLSYGLGIDFVTYYDMVIRFEYAFTSIHTNGFFFGFGMPI
ncbi:MAG: BamA/TamA family outer membrane protein [Mariniphaga sp.]